MASTELWLARFSTMAGSMNVIASRNSKVPREGTILQILGHPAFDMLVKLAAVDGTLFTLTLSDNLPCGLKGVGT